MDGIEELYITYRKCIFRYLYGLTDDYLAAEELTQETFYNMIKSFYTFRGDSKVTTWIYGIARNVYYKWKSKNNKDNVDLDGINEYSFSIHNSSYSPELAFEKKEDNEKIRYVLSSLPEHYREVIVLRDWQGMTYEEVGQIMGRSASWVKVNIFRARAAFKKIYVREEDI